MATKVASVRLGMDSSGFKRGLQEATDASKAAGRNIGGSLRSALAEANRGGVESLKNAGGKVRDALGAVAPLIGAASFGALAKGALDTEQKFRVLVQGVQRGTGQVIAWSDAMKQAQDVSDGLGKSIGTDELGGALQTLFTASGDYGFASESLKAVGIAAAASGKPVEQLAAIAGDLNEKFGISAEQMPEALNTVLSQAERGGLEFEEMSSAMGRLGAVAKQAGIEGTGGFAMFFGMVNAVRDNVGSTKAAVSGMQGIVDDFVSGDLAKKAKVQVGVDVDAMKKGGAEFDEIIATVVSRAKGDSKKLSEIFGGGAKLQTAQAIGGLGTTVEEIETSLEKASKASTSWATVQKQAADNAASGPGRLNAAMEEMRRAFQTPEVTKAITELATLLPKLSKMLAKVVSFAVENPAAATALAVGGTYGKGAIASLVEQALLRGGTSAASSIAGGMSSGGASAGGAIGAQMILAGAAVVAAWAAAGDQLDKLMKESSTKTFDSAGKEVKGGRSDWDTFWDKAALDVGELGEMVSTGGSTTGEAREAYDKKIGITSGVRDARYGDNAGKRSTVDVYTLGEDNGEMAKTGPDAMGGVERGAARAYQDEVDSLTREEDADWSKYARGIGADDKTLDRRAGGGAQGQQGAGGFDRSQAALLADMLGGKELKVRIVNPKEVGAAGPTGNAPPRPGNAAF